MTVGCSGSFRQVAESSGSLIYVPGRSIIIADSSRSVFNSVRKFWMVSDSFGRSKSALECSWSVPGRCGAAVWFPGMLVSVVVFPGKCRRVQICVWSTRSLFGVFGSLPGE